MACVLDYEAKAPRHPPLPPSLADPAPPPCPPPVTPPQVLGADGLIYQEVEDLVACGRDLNPEIRDFDDSCFTGGWRGAAGLLPLGVGACCFNGGCWRAATLTRPALLLCACSSHSTSPHLSPPHSTLPTSSPPLPCTRPLRHRRHQRGVPAQPGGAGPRQAARAARPQGQPGGACRPGGFQRRFCGGPAASTHRLTCTHTSFPAPHQHSDSHTVPLACVFPNPRRCSAYSFFSACFLSSRGSLSLSSRTLWPCASNARLTQVTSCRGWAVEVAVRTGRNKAAQESTLDLTCLSALHGRVPQLHEQPAIQRRLQAGREAAACATAAAALGGAPAPRALASRRRPPPRRRCTAGPPPCAMGGSAGAIERHCQSAQQAAGGQLPKSLSLPSHRHSLLPSAPPRSTPPHRPPCERPSETVAGPQAPRPSSPRPACPRAPAQPRPSPPRPPAAAR